MIHMGSRKYAVHPQHKVRAVPAWSVKAFQHFIAETSLKTAVRTDSDIFPRCLVEVNEFIRFRIADDNPFRETVQYAAAYENTILRVGFVSICFLFRTAQSA